MSKIVRNLKIVPDYFKVFDPVSSVSYNVLLTELLRDGLHYYALQTLVLMRKSNLPLDSYSLCSCLITSSYLNDASFGKQMQAQAAKTGWLSSVFVASALIDFYCKIKAIKFARMVFDEMSAKNTVCANALLSGYIDAKRWNEMIQLARTMPTMNLEYDDCTLLVLLRASARISAIGIGRQLHAFIIRNGYELQSDIFLQSSLIEVYGKSGYIANARRVFDLDGCRRESEGSKDLVLYTSMLGVYGRNGHSKEVIELYQDMLNEGIRPDGVAFVTMIAACGHTGQAGIGLKCFESMVRDFAIEPSAEHYSCVVNMLCRSGRLDEAWKMVNRMMSEERESTSVSMWSALLSASEEHGNVELGEFAAKKALELDPENVGVYMKLSNLYAKYSMWHNIKWINQTLKRKGLKKPPGYSRLSH